jgi:pimeloyl-ACP methyl ester carboxylesterase
LKPVHDKLWADMSRGQNEAFKQMLATIQVPTLVQWGDKDRVLNYKNIEVFAEKIPNIETHIWPGVGHAPMVEIPNESAMLMLEHIAKLD